MRTTGNTILITGGSSGIGLALAERFAALGNTVIICARHQDQLDDARKKIPSLVIRKCDISKESERKELCEWLSSNYGELNILVNNAGIQRKIDMTKGIEEIFKHDDDELEINLRSQIYLAARMVPMLSARKEAAIINVSSGLGFIPLTIFPIYSATKAAIHSFTLSLRQQLRSSSIKVFELIPPTVHDTNLKGKPIPKTDYSVSAAEVADAAIKGLEANEYEITVGATKRWIDMSESEKKQLFDNMNSH